MQPVVSPSSVRDLCSDHRGVCLNSCDLRCMIRVCILLYIKLFCSKVFTPFQKKLTIDDEIQFCSEEVLAEVLKSKVCTCIQQPKLVISDNESYQIHLALLNFKGVCVSDGLNKTIGCFYQGWICSTLRLSQFQNV